MIKSRIQSMGKEADLASARRYEQEARQYDRRANETERLLLEYSEGASRESARQYVEHLRSAAKLARSMAEVHQPPRPIP
jgi:hypothetical protein